MRSRWPRGGMPVVVANPTMPVGPGDRGLSPPTRLILDFCRGKLPMAMDCTLNLIDVRDAALGIDLVMERGATGRRYLLGGDEPHARGPAGTSQPPDGRARSLAGGCPIRSGWPSPSLSEFWADHVTGPDAQATVTGLRLARRLMHFDPSRSLAELGLPPRNLDQSLRDAVAWLRASGLLALR